MGTIAYVANTNTLQLLGLKNGLTSAYLDNATVTVTVNDSRGAPVTGESWPQTMSYVPASSGNYEIALGHVLDLVNRKKYVAIIDADGSDSDGEKWGHWEFHFTAETRTS